MNLGIEGLTLLLQPETWWPPGGTITIGESGWASWGEMFIFGVLVMILVFLILSWLFPRKESELETKWFALMFIAAFAITLILIWLIPSLFTYLYIPPPPPPP
jgi:hypothetical protein